MHLYPKQMRMGLIAAMLVGCAPVPDIQSETNSCTKGESCTVAGNIHVYRGSPASVAELKTSSGCFAVAMTAGDYAKYQKSRGARVRVTGIVEDQDTAEGVVSYHLRDRDVAAGICPAGQVIYAVKVQAF